MPSAPKPDLIVTCALIRREMEVLCTQRGAGMSMPLKWEFPGGKLEPGEEPVACVVREIEEELSLQISVKHLAPEVRYPFRENQTLVLLPFVAEVTGGQLKLLEHASARWCKPEELPMLDWAEADIEVVNWWLNTGRYLD